MRNITTIRPFSIHCTARYDFNFSVSKFCVCMWDTVDELLNFHYSRFGYVAAAAVVVAAMAVLMATKMNFPCAAQDNDVYEWSPEQQGIILGAFYWGFVITQVPGALLSQRYGGKYVMMLGILFSAVCSILTPIVVRESKFEFFSILCLFFFLHFSTSVWLEYIGIHCCLCGERARFMCAERKWKLYFERATIYQSAIIQLHNQFLLVRISWPQ